MPPQPSWFPQIPNALNVLRASSALIVDRQGLQKLLGVSPRTAIRVLVHLGGAYAGKNYVIGREDLIRSLEAIQSGEAYRIEGQRRQRVVDDLDTLRQHLRARQIKLPVAPNPAPNTSLPPGMRLVRPGVLEVEFGSAEDLLARLYELVRIAGKDLEEFGTLVT